MRTRAESAILIPERSARQKATDLRGQSQCAEVSANHPTVFNARRRFRVDL